MTTVDSKTVLNHLLGLLCRSLPMYLRDSAPCAYAADEKSLRVLTSVCEDQAALAYRVAELVQERHGVPDTGEYPLFFTAVHDLSFEYLLQRSIDGQKRDVAAIEQCVQQLRADARARALAEECLGSARGHLETLEELAASQPSRAAT